MPVILTALILTLSLSRASERAITLTADQKARLDRITCDQDRSHALAATGYSLIEERAVKVTSQVLVKTTIIFKANHLYVIDAYIEQGAKMTMNLYFEDEHEGNRMSIGDQALVGTTITYPHDVEAVLNVFANGVHEPEYEYMVKLFVYELETQF